MTHLLRAPAAAVAVLVVSLIAGACGIGSGGLGGAREGLQRASSERSVASPESAAAPSSASEQAAGPGDSQPTAKLDAEGGSLAEERKRIYSGFARLAVDSVEAAASLLVEMAEDGGGYIESMEGGTVVMRVPASGFRELFAGVLLLGRVLDRRIETSDVTEEFHDLEGRLAVARQTRERLYALLEATQDVKQRLAILQEIRRLTEEVEGLLLTLETIERLVAFSRITVELESPIREEMRERQQIPFAWIARLDPLEPTTGRLRARVHLDLGPDFAVFERERSYRAESSEGVRVRIGTVANRPRGDARFWQEALAYHLGPLYRRAERVELGGAVGVRFTGKDRDPYSYLLAVVPRGQRLHVIEVFYPDPEALAARGSAVEAALAAMELR